jgi:hypothetical protein
MTATSASAPQPRPAPPPVRDAKTAAPGLRGWRSRPIPARARQRGRASTDLTAAQVGAVGLLRHLQPCQRKRDSWRRDLVTRGSSGPPEDPAGEVPDTPASSNLRWRPRSIRQLMPGLPPCRDLPTAVQAVSAAHAGPSVSREEQTHMTSVIRPVPPAPCGDHADQLPAVAEPRVVPGRQLPDSCRRQHSGPGGRERT